MAYLKCNSVPAFAFFCLSIWFAWYVVKSMWLNDYKLYLELLKGASFLKGDKFQFVTYPFLPEGSQEMNSDASLFQNDFENDVLMDSEMKEKGKLISISCGSIST